MRSSSRPSLVGILTTSASVLVGCSTPAPDLPRYTGRAAEAGYTAPPSVAPSPAPVALTPTKQIAMLSTPVWEALADEERGQIGERFEVRLVAADGFGSIVDVQGADQSTAGTSGGAALGGAVASAAYIDRALGGQGYSATANLAIGLLGAAAGSTLDKAPTSKFQFRYTVKQGDGEIQYFDEVKSTSFRHSIGVCVLVPSLVLVSTQLCQQTPTSARARFLTKAPAP